MSGKRARATSPATRRCQRAVAVVLVAHSGGWSEEALFRVQLESPFNADTGGQTVSLGFQEGLGGKGKFLTWRYLEGLAPPRNLDFL